MENRASLLLWLIINSNLCIILSHNFEFTSIIKKFIFPFPLNKYTICAFRALGSIRRFKIYWSSTIIENAIFVGIKVDTVSLLSRINFPVGILKESVLFLYVSGVVAVER